MSTVVKDLGAATAYGYAVEKGYTGTEAEFAELMADYAEVGQRAEDAADSALESKTAAQTAATTATNKASEATTAATTATTKAGEASTSASTATSAKDTAVSASQTATTKATEATTAAATATSAKTDAVAANTAAQSAKTAAQTAQTGAETAAASVQSSAAQIQTNADDISELKEDTTQLKSEFTALTSDGVVPSAEQILTDKGITDSVPYHFRRTGGNGADRLYDQIVGGTVCFNQLCNDASVIVQSGRKYLSKIGTAWAVGTSTGTAITGLTSGADMIIDLTAMFGSTIADYIYQLEQTTAGAGVAFFKSLFPNDYYPYNAGELVSVSGLTAHKTVGFNQWDEEWEVGSIDASGNNDPDLSRIRSKNYTAVFPNTNYYFNAPYTLGIRWYAEDKSFISGTSISASSTNKVMESPSNACYLRFSVVGTTTYNHDICINLSDPAKNGTYEPYKAHSYPLDSTLTLRGIPKLSDGKMYFDGDRYLPDGKVERRYGIVDLGTLNWAYNSGNNRFDGYVSNASMTPQKLIVANAIASKYKTVSFFELYTDTTLDKCLAFDKNNLRIRDTDYTDAASFKTAMSGVMLVYELATPTTETADPYQHLQQCDPSGTEEYVSTGIVPIGHNSFYPENLRAKVEQLPWNFSSLIAPTESAFVATRNYVTGDLFIVSNVLYKATSNIANGGTITPSTNCTATTLAEIISALA